MTADDWRAWVRRAFHRPPACPARRRVRLCLELLEDRTAPATFTVTLGDDANPFSGGTADPNPYHLNSGDLRWCLTAANNTESTATMTIQFDLPGSGPQTINLGAALPGLRNHPVVIDGTTQPGYSGTPLITLVGPSGQNFIGFNLTDANTAGSRISGLAIDNFAVGIEDIGVNDVTIANDYIGVAADGVTAAGNLDGVILSASNCVVSDNVISGNQQVGVFILGDLDSPANNNVLTGNKIGTDASGTSALANAGAGVLIQGESTSLLDPQADSNVIGGSTPQEGNVIAWNDGPGVAVVVSDPYSEAIGNRIIGNSIFNNGGPGIDLGEDGPTPNDTPPPGPNDFQNHPILTSASGDQVVGSLEGDPNATYEIQFFATPPSGGSYQGQTFLGEITQGPGTFDATLTTAPPPGWIVTATATNTMTGDTSEFSPGVTVPAGGPTVSFGVPLVVADVGQPLNAGGSFTASEASSFSATVDYGDGAGPQPLALSANNTFTLQHVYQREGEFTVHVVVTDDQSGASSGPATLLVEVFIPGTNDSGVAVAAASQGQDVVATASGVTAELFHDDPGVAVLLVTPLPSLVPGTIIPTQPGTGAFQAASYDVRGISLGPDDVVVVTFTYPADGVAPVLQYFDPKTGRFVPVPEVVNTQNHTVTARFSLKSVPSDTDLDGTVFTISVTPAPDFLRASAPPPITADASANNASSSASSHGSFLGTVESSAAAAASGALPSGAGAAAGGGSGDDPNAQASQDILSDLPSVPSDSGDTGAPPSTAVLSPSQSTLPDKPPPNKPPPNKTPGNKTPGDNNPPAPDQTKTPAPPGPSAPSDQSAPPDPRGAVAPPGPGAVQRTESTDEGTRRGRAAVLAVDLVLAAGVSFVLPRPAGDARKKNRPGFVPHSAV